MSGRSQDGAIRAKDWAAGNNPAARCFLNRRAAFLTSCGNPAGVGSNSGNGLKSDDATSAWPSAAADIESWRVMRVAGAPFEAGDFPFRADREESDDAT